MKPAASRVLQVLAVVVYATMVLLAPATARSQEARGTITGKVKDANDAVLPGASVKIINTARGTSVTLSTNDAGFFQAPYLLPGTYQVVIEVNGFKKYIRDGLLLQIGNTLVIAAQASYTHSKFMQATEYLNPADPLPTEVISDTDYPNRFAMSAIFELPFGKGRMFLGDANGFVSRLVSGWQIQGVYTYQSGA